MYNYTLPREKWGLFPFLGYLSTANGIIATGKANRSSVASSRNGILLACVFLSYEKKLGKKIIYAST